MKAKRKKTIDQTKQQSTSNASTGGHQAALIEEINKPYVRQLIEKGHGYRLCIADEMPAATKARWETWLYDAIKKIKPSAPVPNVLTASDIASWVNRYPALVMRFRSSHVVKSLSQWSSEVRALTADYIKTSQWPATVAAIKGHVDLSQRIDTVLTIQGEAGVGKSRMTCEVLAEDAALMSLVAATNDEQEALRFAEFVSREPYVKAILVADECSLLYREKIQQLLPYCWKRLRVIAIDNSLQRSPGKADEIRLVQLTLTEVDRILSSNFPVLPLDRRQRFARLAGGFLRLAVDMCRYEHLIPSDGDISPVSNKFLDSYLTRRLDEEKCDAVRLISLLPRIGYRDDVALELLALCNHPMIKLDGQKVIRIAQQLKHSPGFIAFAGRYLYVTPALIAQVTFQSAWDNWIEPDAERFLSELDPNLLGGFLERTSQAPSTPSAVTVTDFFYRWARTLVSEDSGEPGDRSPPNTTRGG